jgi:hypothetical protein
VLILIFISFTEAIKKDDGLAFQKVSSICQVLQKSAILPHTIYEHIFSKESKQY